MFFVYFGVYIALLLIIWGFFGVAWVHANKFKNFSTHIGYVSRFLLFVLLVLSALGFFIIFSLVSSNGTSSVVQPGSISPGVQQNYY